MHPHRDSAATVLVQGGSLSDRVVIVTGGGQGIGRAFARAFAAKGARVVIPDINREKAEAVARQIDADGGKALALQVDVGDAVSVAKMGEDVLSHYGRIDVLINNAAIFSTIKMRPFYEIPLDEWTRVLQVNVTGPFLCCRAVVPAMRDQKWGRIINISSGAVTLGRPNYTHYTTSKSALIGMTRSLARELGGFGITVNSILPGATFTEIERETITPEWTARIIAQQCVHRPQTPDDLVGAALFLASDASEFVTGQSLTVDGGATHL
jgi:3-oxoacyl-[acyl-carrier protein] reductase